MGNYVITLLFVSLINEEFYSLDFGLKSLLFLISSKSTLGEERDSFVKYYYICLLAEIVYAILCYTR